MNRLRTFHITGPHIDVYGDTYPLRVRLKELGGLFQGNSKAWRLPHEPEVLEAILAMGFQPVNPGVIHSTEIRTETSKPLAEPQLTVVELCEQIDRSLRAGLPGRFWLVGELSHVQLSRGNVWLEIADSSTSPEAAQTRKASIQAVIFADVLLKMESKLSKLAGEKLPLETGLQIRIAGRLSFWQEGAKITLVIDEVDLAYTAGRLALNRERILAELRRKRLIEKNGRLPWVPLPLRIALVTANESRARNDFLHELSQMGFPFQVTLFDCRMQGESTSKDVVRALSLIAQRCEKVEQGQGFDVVVITRGGGSRMDLRWFDDLPIAVAIAECPVPVVTAIGHFEDNSIADQVAAVCEKTPTAAAQHLGGLCAGTINDLTLRMRRVAGRAQKRLTREQEILAALLQKIVAAARGRLSREGQKLDSAERLLAFARRQIAGVLERGYALVWDSQRLSPIASSELLTRKPTDFVLELKRPGQKGCVWIPVVPDWSKLLDEPLPESQAPEPTAW